MSSAVRKDQIGVKYAARFLAAVSEAVNEGKVPPSDAEDGVDNKDFCFTTATVDSGISGDICNCPVP